MKNKLKNIMDNMETKDYRVVRVNKREFELENGDVYPHLFELDDDVSVEEFQKLLDLSKNNIINHMKKINNIDE